MRSLTLVLFAMVVLAGSALAANQPPSTDSVGRMARMYVVVPTAWDGIYTTVDSSYTCAGVLQNTSTGADTICGGKDYSFNTSGSPIQFNCTGSATASSFNMHCTGSYQLDATCTALYDIVTNGTLSGSTSHVVSVTNVTYSGTGTICSILQPTCSQSDSWGTRTGPAPTSFCNTPTVQHTWGTLKSRYR